MPLDFTAHRRGEPALLDRVATVIEACRTIARVPLASVATFGCPFFHGGGDVVAQFDFRKIDRLCLLISDGCAYHRAPRIHAKDQRLGMLVR